MKTIDRGIFLHRIAYSETSLITTFYTEKYGIQKFIFQGGKKKNAALFPLSLCELTFYRRRDSELAKLTAAIPDSILNELLNHPIKSTIAFFIAEVIKSTQKTNEGEAHVYAFLENKITELNQTNQIHLFPLVFLCEYTHYIGITPDADATNPIAFNLIEGVFVDHYSNGDLIVTGEKCTSLHALFNTQLIPSSTNHKLLLETLLEYYRIHIPEFNISKAFQIIKEILY